MQICSQSECVVVMITSGSYTLEIDRKTLLLEELKGSPLMCVVVVVFG